MVTPSKNGEFMKSSAGENQAETSLASLVRGQKAKIVRVRGQGPIRRRILDMGLVPGSEVEVIRKAPLGDPVEFRIKGYYLSLRKIEAELVLVQPLEAY